MQSKGTLAHLRRSRMPPAHFSHDIDLVLAGVNIARHRLPRFKIINRELVANWSLLLGLPLLL